MTFSVTNQLKGAFALPFNKTAGYFPSVEIAAPDLGLALHPFLSCIQEKGSGPRKFQRSGAYV
ncbi:hypothetical protein KGY63_03945 [Candidatus Bipolaricaulota bacterium]|nr:hypothetical protein [Candidatus Bipolaricaulota bacterium]